MVLTNGEGNVLAADEESNTIVEVAYGSGVVLDSNGNIVASGDAVGNVVLTDCQGNILSSDKEGNTIIETAEVSGAMLD